MLTLSSELQLWPASFHRMYNSTSIILYVSGSQPTARGLHAARHESECGSPCWMLQSYVLNIITNNFQFYN